MFSSSNFYELLNLTPSASQEEVKAAYRRVVKGVHPDTGAGTNALFGLVNQAYDTLSDPVRRAAYDRDLAAGITFDGTRTPTDGHAKDASQGESASAQGAARQAWSLTSAMRRARDAVAAQVRDGVAGFWGVEGSPKRRRAVWLVPPLAAGFLATVAACTLVWAHVSYLLEIVPREVPVGYDTATGTFLYDIVLLAPPGDPSAWILGFLAFFVLVNVWFHWWERDREVNTTGAIIAGELVGIFLLNAMSGGSLREAVTHDGMGEPPAMWLFFLNHPELTAWASGLVAGVVSAAALWGCGWVELIARRRRRARQERERWAHAEARTGPQHGQRAGGPPAAGEIWWADVPFEDTVESKVRPVLVTAASDEWTHVLMFTSQDKSGRSNYHQSAATGSFLRLDRTIQLRPSELRNRFGYADPATMAAAQAGARDAGRC